MAAQFLIVVPWTEVGCLMLVVRTSSGRRKSRLDDRSTSKSLGLAKINFANIEISCMGWREHLSYMLLGLLYGGLPKRRLERQRGILWIGLSAWSNFGYVFSVSALAAILASGRESIGWTIAVAVTKPCDARYWVPSLMPSSTETGNTRTSAAITIICMQRIN